MISNIEYANAYSEVLGILKYIPLKDYNKIPERKIKAFEKNANKDYKFYFNPGKTLDEQNVSKRAKAILGILFRDYWATELQRNKITTKQNCDRQKLEEEKKLKYNADNIFRNNNKNAIIDNIDKKQEIALVEIKDIKWYKKIWTFLSKFLKK